MGGGSDDASNYEGEEELKQTHFYHLEKKTGQLECD